MVAKGSPRTLLPDKVMSVVPIAHPQLTQADIRTLVEYGVTPTARGIAGACVPSTTELGSPAVVLLDTSNTELLYAFGKEYGWYYVLDRKGTVLAHSHFLEEIIEMLPIQSRFKLPLGS